PLEADALLRDLDDDLLPLAQELVDRNARARRLALAPAAATAPAPPAALAAPAGLLAPGRSRGAAGIDRGRARRDVGIGAAPRPARRLGPRPAAVEGVPAPWVDAGIDALDLAVGDRLRGPRRRLFRPVLDVRVRRATVVVVAVAVAVVGAAVLVAGRVAL